LALVAWRTRCSCSLCNSQGADAWRHLARGWWRRLPAHASSPPWRPAPSPKLALSHGSRAVSPENGTEVAGRPPNPPRGTKPARDKARGRPLASGQLGPGGPGP